MRWLGEIPSPAISGPFGLVVQRAIEQGAPEPKVWVFLDRDGRWLDSMACLSLAERRSCVAVVLHDEDLVAATRWSIGGGVLLPPSLSRVSAACHAAQEALAFPLWTADPQTVSEFDTKTDRLTVGLRPAGLWQAMVGLRGQLEVLGALAAALDRPAVIGPGPSLTLGCLHRSAIETAWERLLVRPQWAVESCFLKIGESDLGGIGKIDGEWWPVAQWPSGRIVARWRIDVANTTCPWRLETDGGTVLHTEAVSTRTEMERSTADIVRIHGVPSSEIEREGSPGAVVIEGVAREAERSGQTLWIPGVSQASGVVVRRWGLNVWVDGPVLTPFQLERN